MESIADAASAEADWDKHKAQHGIKTTTCPPRGEHCYAKIRERFMFKKYPHRWATGVELRNTLECHKLAKKHGMDHIINDFLEHDVDVTSANLNNAFLFHTIIEIITKVFTLAVCVAACRQSSSEVLCPSQ